MQNKILLTMAATAICNMAMAQEKVPAFPGAEGNGRYTTGGRGGEIIHVTNLNDSGKGSFREAVKGNGKKTIVFDVGGVIALNKNLSIGDNTTILGQTAPYPGITLRYYTISPGSNNIIRFIRVRRGEERNVNDGADAIEGRELNSVIIDHCSFSWSIDEVASFYDNNNFTMQWCTIGESLNNAGHDKGAHGYGGIWGGKLASFHHNMIAHVNNRAPRFNGARYDWTGYTSNTEYGKYNWSNAVQAENVDFRNCLIFDWGGGGCYGGPGGGYINMVNNYYKATPETTNKNRVTQVSIANATTSDNSTYIDMTSRYFISGNYVSGYGANYDWKGVKYDRGVQTINGEHYTLDVNKYYGSGVEYVNNSEGKPCVRIRLEQPVAPAGTVTTHSAEQAYSKILAYGGASLFRDDIDARYMSEARNGTSTYTGSRTKIAGRIDRVGDVDGYTEKNFPQGSRDAGYDTDNDGMPDAWERANGLNPGNPADASAYTLDPKGYYTNLEVFANSIVEEIMKGGNADAESPTEEYYPAASRAESVEYYTGRVVERLQPNPTEPSVTPGTPAPSSVITWMFNAGTHENAAFRPDAGDAASGSAITIGGNLSATATRTVGNVEFTLLQPVVRQTAPKADNTVTFSFTLKDGYSFVPTKIAFDAVRIGTDDGLVDAVYTTDAASQTVTTALKPNRNNNQAEPFTRFSGSVAGLTPKGGIHAVTFNIYALGNTKQIGLANITIEGILTSPTGISGVHAATLSSDTVAYTPNGLRTKAGYKGIVIRKGRKHIQN